MKKNITFAIFLLVITGCGGVQLIDESGRVHAGNFDSITKRLEGRINGKQYSGFYVTDAGSMYFSGMSQGTTATHVSGQAAYTGSVGRAILTAADGDSLECEFNYSGYRAIGTCLGSDGERYRLLTR